MSNPPDNIKYEKECIVGSGEVVKLFYVLDVGGNGARLALTDQKNWVLDIGQDVLVIDPFGLMPMLMRLLELPYEDVREAICLRIKNLKEETTALWSTFPAKQVIRTGIYQQSDYWADLSLQWVPYLDFKDQLDLLADVRFLANSEWASQRIRHRALKLMSGIRKIKSD